jgi:hypothetical protein
VSVTIAVFALGSLASVTPENLVRGAQARRPLT